MRKLLLLVSVALLTACSHKISTNFQSAAPAPADTTCNPEIRKKSDLFGLNTQYLGSITLDEPVVYMRRKVCSEEAAMEILKTNACNLNANLINITLEIKPGEDAPPYPRSACYRCIANYYYVEINETSKPILKEDARKTIGWEDKTKITWDNFLIELPETSEIPYEFSSRIYISWRISPWTGAFKDYKAQGTFYCDVSKAKKSFRTAENEKQIELLFSLTHLYAKRLEQDLNSRKPKISNKRKLYGIINMYDMDMKNAVTRFYVETEYGENKAALQKWEDEINTELKQFTVGEPDTKRK
ncbi:MAG TPA: hypothetical protein PLV51_02165 [Lentimicrobium sp.]|mgnify:CR=1 FL=1|jgi:hypothetical protein|nr:hypothetical protein [Lentimicrobium sp.]